MTADEGIAQARVAAMTLIAAREADATVCPSEVARAMAASRGDPAAWRDVMPVVHAVVDQMLGEDLIRLSWKGRTLDCRAGPYRIRRGPGGQADRGLKTPPA